MNNNRRQGNDPSEFQCRLMALEDIEFWKEMITKNETEFIGDLFEKEALRFIKSPPNAFLCLVKEEITAVICVTKSDVDYSIWGLSWLFVSPPFRGKGLAGRLIQESLGYIRNHRYEYPTGDCLIELTTTIPSFHEKFGFQVIYNWISSGQTMNLMIHQLED